jgi:predicted outer membrane repeat protein
MTLTNITVRNSRGIGVTLVDAIGLIEIRNSTFENNSQGYYYGGGVYIKFSMIHNQLGRYSKIVFLNDSFNSNNNYSLSDKPHGQGGGLGILFEDNSWYKEKVIVVAKCDFISNKAENGGGMNLKFTGNTTRNDITIKDCTFTHNTAHRGGGLSMTFDQNSLNNSVYVTHTKFDKNSAKTGGGGMKISLHYSQTELPGKNVVSFSHCNMTENRAQYGGGAVLHYTRTKTTTQNNQIQLNNCSWASNTARFGSAVEISLHKSDTLGSGYALRPSFKNCQFVSNHILKDVSKRGYSANYTWGKGVLLITGLPIMFSGKTVFQGSNTSAIYASSSIINFAVGSNVEFIGNHGWEGGAVNLIGLSAMHIRDNSTFLFRNNSAHKRGGAIMYTSTNKLDFVSSRNCFIRYVGHTKVTNKRSITITFENNRAISNGKNGTFIGHTIFATTLLPCRRACKENGSVLGCIGNVSYRNNRTHELSTDGAKFIVPQDSLRVISAIPGKEIDLNFTLIDDENEEAYNSYHVSVWTRNRSTIAIDPAYSYIKDKTIKLFGRPGDRAYLIVVTDSFRGLAMALTVEMEHCPPGFVIQTNSESKGEECACSAKAHNKTYYGIFQCNTSEYRAILLHGFWVGYDDNNGTESTLRSGYCPRGFCTRKENEVQLPIERSQYKLNRAICGDLRTGNLCGSCSDNNSVFYHSSNYYCHDNKSNCRFGAIFYVVSELVPVTLLFVAIIVFNVKFTSGALNGLIFFFQFIDTMLVDANGFIQTNKVMDTFAIVYQFIYRMFILNFFTLDKFSFCLWKGANTLDILAFKYLTVVYSIMLVILTVALKKVCNPSCVKNRKFIASSNTSVKNTMIHGFSAFFVMCYSQCAKVTLFILTPGRVYSMGSVNITSVVFYHGDYLYLKGHHLKYALPAVLFGITIVLIPPLLLVVYPLCYKVLALFHMQETRCTHIICRVMPLERMKPIFDSFQGCFKDQYRFFAGLYFIYRLVALLSFLITDSLTKFYIALEVQLIVMLTLQATTYAYKRRWHNLIDVLLFANLAIINALTMHNYKRARDPNPYTTSINIVSAVQTFLILFPFVYVVCYYVTRLVWVIKRSKKSTFTDSLALDTLALVDYRQLNDSNM